MVAIGLEDVRSGYLLIEVVDNKDTPYAPSTKPPGQLKNNLKKELFKVLSNVVCSFFKFIDL